MPTPAFRDLRRWEAENWRFFAGSPVGNVYGEPGWICQDQTNGDLWVHGLGNDMVTWSRLTTTATGATLGAATVNNAAGNTAVAPTVRIFSQEVTVTVADGRTSIVILDVTGRLEGDLLFLNLASAIAGVTIEIRNASAVGTLLDTWLTASSSGFFQFVFRGGAWVRQSGAVPA